MIHYRYSDKYIFRVHMQYFAKGNLIHHFNLLK